MKPITIITIFTICMTGWAINLYKLTQLDFQPPLKTEFFRAAGVIPAFGAIIGFITFEEETK